MSSIKTQIKTIRIDFSSERLNEKTVSRNPLILFREWLQLALDSKIPEPNAMTLATVAEDGMPDARIVLLRDYSKTGFSFFTNYNSIKGSEIRHNKKACINFFWSDLHRQVRIRGTIIKTSAKESNSYFASRPRESQFAAWASNQSEELLSRSELEVRYSLFQNKFRGKKVPRPPHWGGYILKPVYFEFWQGQTNRLHDRIVYKQLRNGKWKITRLNP